VDFKLQFAKLLKKEDSPRPTAVLFDEIESMRRLELSDSFFSTLRTMYGTPKDQPILEHFTCAFACVADPSALVSDPDISPFNVGERIWLEDLTPQETRQLTEHLNKCG
jgi:hypothetical protein